MIVSRSLYFTFTIMLLVGQTQSFVGPNRNQLAVVSVRNHKPTDCRRPGYAAASEIGSFRLRGMFDQDEEIVGSDRLKSCIPYFLPLLDGDRFGQYIYEHIPPLGFLNSLFIGPLAEVYRGIPFLGVIIFMALTLGTRFNSDMNRNVRFNAQQAALLDVALIVPELVAASVDDTGGIPRYIVEGGANFVWYTYMSIVIYSVYGNLRGQKPNQVPYLSASADLMVGPF